jgi:ABC-2 type transport system ATP-binding protein
MLQIQSLSFAYGQKDILHELNLSCKEGQIHGILGLNGAGKTTFFRLLFGFLKTPKGKILWNESPLLRENISFLEADNYFYPYTRGMEYVQLCTEQKVSELQILAWNEIFELPLNDLIDTYSTGMRKKLAFLACLLQNRPILLLDEPFNGIDLESSERLFLVLEKIRDSGKTIILSSHILSSLTTICDHIYHLNHGFIEKTYHRANFEELQSDIRGRISTQLHQQLSELNF